MAAMEALRTASGAELAVARCIVASTEKGVALVVLDSDGEGDQNSKRQRALFWAGITPSAAVKDQLEFAGHRRDCRASNEGEYGKML